NNTGVDVLSVNSERKAKIFGRYDGIPYLRNSKSHINNFDKSVSGRSYLEVVDLTQAEGSDDDVEMRSEKKQIASTSRCNGVKADFGGRLSSLDPKTDSNEISFIDFSDWNIGKHVTVQERSIDGYQFQGASGDVSNGIYREKNPVKGNLYQHDNSMFEHIKPPLNAQERPAVGLQFQGGSGVVSNRICREDKPVAGKSYQHGEFRFEQGQQVTGEWMGGAASSDLKPASNDDLIENREYKIWNDYCHANWNEYWYANWNDYSYANWLDYLYANWNPDLYTYWNEILHTNSNQHSYTNGNHDSSTKAEDERLTYKAALQDLAQPTLEAIPDNGLLTVTLLRHQRIALAWMVQKETNNMNCAGGILADDQGLGKTVSTIALILKERPAYQSFQKETSKIKLETSTVNLDEDDVVAKDFERKLKNHNSNDLPLKEHTYSVKKGRPSAGTLIVCPTSVLRQWAQEIRDKVTAKASLSVLVYHGSNRTKDPNELERYDVVLTTFPIVSMEVPKQKLDDNDEEFEENQDFWKKTHSETVKKKNRRGSELGPGPLAKVGWFRVVLDEAQIIKNRRTQVARACWGLRAKRRWCLSGTPIQNSIDDLYSYFRFLKYDPYAVYRSFCSTIKFPISRNPSSGYKKLQAVLKTIMLRRTKGTVIDGEPILKLPPKSVTLKKIEFSAEEREFYNKLELDSRAQFKVYQEAGTLKQNYVNILVMLLRLRQACNHPLLVKARSSDSTWRSSTETARKLPREKLSGLINCLESSLAICGICNDTPEEALVTLCGHVFCNQCLSAHLTQPGDTICPFSSCESHLKADSVFSLATLQDTPQKHTSMDQMKDVKSENLLEDSDSTFEDVGAPSAKIKAVMETLQALPKVPTSIAKSTSVNINDAGPLGMRSDDNIVQENASELYEELKPRLKKQIIEIQEKAIVFSQWTKMLDFLELPLKQAGIQYRRLDGTMSVLERDEAVNDFKKLPKVTVILMSLKAASLGLNMVAACHVILIDPWWNPTVEDQAIDRAHRIGQTRPVQVSRFTVTQTVEDRILALQQQKREIVAAAFGEDEAGVRRSHLTEEDLRYLFMV
ncbi:hypothetical protein KI387_033860, partial [Taxus chinensis]